MANWGSQANNAANSVLWATTAVHLTPNTTNQTALFNNVSTGVWTNASRPERTQTGVFGVTTTAKNAANASSENKKIAHTGWVIRQAGTGPITGIAVANSANAANFANGETVKISGGTVNGFGTVATNATGFPVTVALQQGANSGSGWAAAGDAVFTFTRERHVSNVTVTGAGTGYLNTDIVTVSNGTVNASATVSTNSIGGLTNASFTITNVGLFPTGTANTSAAVAIANSTGGASAGSGATFSVNLTTSSNGQLTVTVGGRAGRVHYETLVAGGSLIGAGSAQFPNT